jgi:transposase
VHAACELVEDLTTTDVKIKEADKQLTALAKSAAATLRQLNGIGPSGAARLLGDVGDIHRFASPAHFAAWNGTAPLDASSGDQKRHRLSRAGSRRINRVLHIMAVVQLRHDTPGRLVPSSPRRRQDRDGHSRSQAPSVRCGLSSHDLRRETGRLRRRESGRTTGGDSDIRRGQPNPDS